MSINPMRMISLYSVFLLFTSCSKMDQELITLDFERDLFPEGIAIDSRSQVIFLNSLKYNKIVKCNIDGSNPSDFIKSNQYNYLPGFGMLVRGDTLFALGNSLPKQNSRSILLLISTKTGALIDSYVSPDTTFKYLNDLAVGANGDIFITDSESDKVYLIQLRTKVMEVYLESEAIANSNGIAISDDDNYLYLASYKNGIRIIERATKKLVNEPNLDYRGIDGMKYYKNSLIAIVNGKRARKKNGVYRFYLNKEGTSIIRSEKMLSYQEIFDFPTTFAIRDGYMYFTVNTHLNNYDGVSKQVINSEKLEAYRIMKLKIDL